MMMPRPVHVSADEDRAFREFLLRASPEPVRSMFGLVLRNGPSRGGSAESRIYYGAELNQIILTTVPVINELEWFQPGFKKWLNATGFGNDKDMIAAFAKWGQMEISGELRHGLHDRVALQ